MTEPQTRPLVLDASAFLSGKPLPRDAPLVVPDSVLGEVTGRGRDRRAVDYALEAGLRVVGPSREALARVEKIARETGDAARLSAADRDILAVALDLEGVAVTDDYSIQNVAQLLGVPVRSSGQRGIRAVWTWTRRCTGCRREVGEKDVECPVCGSPVRTVRKR